MRGEDDDEDTMTSTMTMEAEKCWHVHMLTMMSCEEEYTAGKPSEDAYASQSSNKIKCEEVMQMQEESENMIF